MIVEECEKCSRTRVGNRNGSGFQYTEWSFKNDLKKLRNRMSIFDTVEQCGICQLEREHALLKVR